MFFHNLKYTIKTLFKNKVLIFWTFMFPIILGVFFNMAFSNIENDEVLKVFDIGVVDDDNFKNEEIYSETLKKLSNGDDKLFNINYSSKDELDSLLDDSKIEGYIYFKDNEPNIVIKENGIYQTIIKFVITEIEQNKNIITDLSKKEIEKEIIDGNYQYDINSIVNNILNKINDGEIELKNTSNSNLSYMTIEYYTLIAMACMYGGMLGLTAINGSLANMSNKGKRIAISPTKKSVIVLSSLIGSYIVSLIGLSLLMLFLLFVLKVDFGDKIPYIILLSIVGNLAGIAMGVLIASTFKVSEGAKTGITIAISMFLSVLSGMMGVLLKYTIDKNFPIINMMNPNNLITDGFYSLYYYDTLTRYTKDIISLLIFIAVCLIISFVSLRREKYDSI